MSDRGRVLVLGFDSAPGTLLRRWADAGELPAVAELIARGATAPLGSFAGFLPESIWPSVVTGCEPATHGVYNYRETRPGTYVRVRRPPRSFRQPFWRLTENGAGPARTVLLDVPGPGCDPGPGVVQALSWGQRRIEGRRTEWPPGLLDRITERHGEYARNLNREAAGRPRVERRQLRALEQMAERRTAVLRELMDEDSWDLCMTVYYEAHDAGHSFHQYTDPASYPEAVPRTPEFEDALLRVYKKVDAGIGELVAAAPPDTTVAVVSGFGLRPNTNGQMLLPRLLEALGYTVPATPSSTSRATERARRIVMAAVPRALVRGVRRLMLPPDVVDRHVARLWSESTDWARSRAWAEMEPGSGWIRINVAGREPEGIVAPGAEYDAVVAEITADLLALRDADTGVPAIANVLHRDELTKGPNADKLPDLLIEWTRETVVRRAVHPRAGTVTEDDFEWRVTEHDGDGLLVLAGPAVEPGASVPEARVEDVAPTLIHLLGGHVPEDVDGRVLTELLVPPLRSVRTAAIDCSDDGWSPA